MDRVTSKQLFESRRRVTRFQVNVIKKTFPFLLLPPELRNMVYAFAIDLTTLNQFFDKDLEKAVCVKKTKSPRKQRASLKSTPPIFLVCKQISNEASWVLQKQGVTFQHGLLGHRLEDVISPNVIRKLSSIEITDAGHGTTDHWGRTVSWFGYINLLKQLGELLSTGEHKLKKLTVELNAPGLVEHMTICHESGRFKCGFRDTMTKALATLSKARGIGEVILRGLNVDEAARAKELMEGPACKFFSLPREIRDMIYEHSLDWSDVSNKLADGLADWPDRTATFPFPLRTTPTVLVVNRQMHEEAAEVLAKKPLNITFPADKTFDDQDCKIPSVLGLIPRRTLERVTTIHINMQGWFWVFNFEPRFIRALANSQALKHLKITFNDHKKPDFLGFPGQVYPDNVLASKLKALTEVRGLETVTFEGDLPVVYKIPLVTIMTSGPEVPLHDLPRPMGINSEGHVLDVDDLERP
ncbi:unnamed protein product [Cercospora beticola]|nr:unnamed protein product [Cercospora beticola]